MLVCPHCQFENSYTNKFCQECGTSLTQKTCPECGSPVSLTAIQCPTCSTLTGTVWLAIVRGFSSTQPKNTALFTEGTFLDAQQRYQLLSLPPHPDATAEFQVRVLDCQPFQQSPLQTTVNAITTLEMQPSAAESADLGTSSPLKRWSDLEAVSESVSDTSPPTEGLQKGAIPVLAQPYLALQSKFHQNLPAVHDAWQQDEQSAILLEDYSHLPLLQDLLHDQFVLAASGKEDLEPDATQLQILYWLNEMLDLWEALIPWHCCQSLLKLTNLRVDEDRVLRLQRLYFDAEESVPTLQELGQSWHLLFAQPQSTLWSELPILLNDLQTGKILTLEELRSRIETAAHKLQAHLAPTVIMPETYDSESSDLPPALPVPPPLTANPVAPPETTDNSASASSTRLEVQVDQAELDSAESETDNDDLPTVVLPMQLSNLEYAGRTDIGRQRDHNEDYFGVETQISKLESPSGRTVHAQGLYILCDGMGGHAGGEVASALAVDTLRQYFQTYWSNNSKQGEPTERGLPGPEILRDAVRLANKTIYDINQQNARSGSGRMGTTLVMALLQDTEVAVVHVGDSRLYRFSRKRGLEQVTIDHEVGQREIQRGVDPEIAYGRPDAYQLTQALGPRDENFTNPDVQYMELNEDTLLLLCSDGLTDNNLLETHWQTHIEPLLSSQANLEQGVIRLIDLANQYNGHDNITALVIQAKVRPNLETIRQ